MKRARAGVFLWLNLSNVCSRVILLLICGGAHAAPVIDVEPVISGLYRPVAIIQAGDGSHRLFITLQQGQIKIYKAGQVFSTPFLDIRDRVSQRDDQGLLGVAFHPRYASNGLFYVDYTDTEGKNVIARYAVSPTDPNVADPNSEAVLLEIKQSPAATHYGGHLQFGPDGYFYIGMGDGEWSSDPPDIAQNLGTLLGKMLRIDVDNVFPYAIPPGNPFVENPQARPEIWALGLRNPWRFSFDRLKGHLFIADVGQDNWEEVDFQPASSPGGENYGWPRMEGNHCLKPAADCNGGTLTLPVLEYNHEAGCAIIGGYRYRGTRLPRHYGAYIYGDFCSGRIWGARRDEQGKWISTELLDTDLMITAFGESERRELFVADYAAGTIYRLVTRNEGPLIIANETVKDLNGGTLEPGDEIKFEVTLWNLGDTDQPDNPGREFQGKFNYDRLELLGVMASSGQVIVKPKDDPIRWNGVIPAHGQVRITIRARIRPAVTGKVCNRGLAYYDADLNGSNETQVPTDDPSSPVKADRSCAEIGQGAP